MGGAVAVPPMVASGQVANVAQATPGDSPMLGGSESLRAVAEPAIARLFVYRVSDLAMVGKIEDVVAQTHVGFLPMPDGSLLFVDERSSQIMAISAENGTLAVDSITSVPVGVSHFAVNSDHARYAAVGTGDPVASVVLIDLATRETTTISLPESGEVGLVLPQLTLPAPPISVRTSYATGPEAFRQLWGAMEQLTRLREYAPERALPVS